METIRDRFWLWGHDAGSHDVQWNLPGTSRITPVEATFYMAIPNIVMVRYDEESQPPSTQYSVPFRPLREVVWSIVGGGGITERSEREQVIELAGQLPNMTGVMMDDFFRSEEDGDQISALSLEELKEVKALLGAAARPLDLWVVLYAHQLHMPVRKHLELCDNVAFWTWEAKDIDKLEDNFAQMESIAPSCRRILGCYMWDYGTKNPIPVDLMRKQCTLGLQWLREGRIEGMIFLASCICDLDLEAVEWTRRWIGEVGDQSV